jgi:hypothetical protein
MVLGGKQIAAPGVVAASTHGAPDDATELAADEDSLFWAFSTAGRLSGAKSLAKRACFRLIQKCRYFGCLTALPNWGERVFVEDSAVSEEEEAVTAL